MKYGRAFTAILLLSLVIFALLPRRIVQADTYEVTNANNSGPGSLRQAISDANSRPGPDTIIFQQNDKGFFITLTGPDGEDANVSGDLDILDGGDLTIIGNGTNMTTIDAGGIDRVFHICPGASCSNTVTISGVSIQNGYVTDDGGGLLNEGASVLIQNSAVGKVGAGNQAGLIGGGIHNSYGTMTVNNTTISANSADYGGGISNSSVLTVQNGSLIGGIGAANDANIGGGIYNGAGTTTVLDSFLIANDASEGGGILNFSGTVTLDGSALSANTAGSGGGVFNIAVLNVVNGSAIGTAGAGNEAEDSGAGIFNRGDGVVTVDASTVSDNNVNSGIGGGIYNEAELILQNGSTIGGEGARNHADYGGGIYNDDNGETTIGASFVSANIASLNGGGIYNNSGTITINNSSVDSNSADNGGGIYNRAELTVQNGSIIEVNTVTERGGGIYCATESLTINASSIIENDANDLGGGILINVSCDVTVDDSSISTNEAHHGGGIYNFGALTIQNSSEVSANEADSGGGIYSLGTLNIQNSSIGGSVPDGNQALTGHGGGIYNDDGGTTTVGTSFVNANSASQNGGGIYIDSGTITITNSSVNENSAQNGGGVFNDSGTLMVQNGSTIGGDAAGNFADNNGGGIYNNGWLTVNGSTIGNVNSAASGGGIYNNAKMMVTGSRIINNTATATGGGVFNNENTIGATRVMSSCIVSNSAASFNNNQPSKQVATVNWWGAPTGPNTPGADTVNGNVDTSGFLTAPILDCAPDLEVGKTNDSSGNASVGETFQWILTVTNTGPISGTFDAGEAILVDDLPAGASYQSPVVGNIVSVANDANIQCSITNNILSCTAQGGHVTLGPLTGRFEVTFSVTPLEPGTLINPVSICRVDPARVVDESNESNNNCTADVVIVNQRIYIPLVLR